jgi:DNA helicase-2/ATP-dependent DNA helicase PcrA
MAGEDGEERWDNILELRAVAQDYANLKPGESLSAFLEGVTLVSDVDALKEAVDAVTLVTLHQAKGLEFPVVFIVGVEDGILPHFRSMDDQGQLEEERRLFYVGITRAKERVYLLYSFRRHLMGASTVSKPSRFLEDIPKNLVANVSLWQVEEGGRVAPAVYTWNRTPVTAPKPPLDLPQLKAGDHVRHPQFGEGLIVSSRPAADDIEVVVAFNNGGGIKKLLLSFAKLEKIEK